MSIITFVYNVQSFKYLKFSSSISRTHEEVSAAKSGSRNNNRELYDRELFKSSTPHFPRGRPFFFFFIFSFWLRTSTRCLYSTPIYRALWWCSHCNQTGTVRAVPYERIGQSLIWHFCLSASIHLNHFSRCQFHVCENVNRKKDLYLLEVAFRFEICITFYERS